MRDSSLGARTIGAGDRGADVVLDVGRRASVDVPTPTASVARVGRVSPGGRRVLRRRSLPPGAHLLPGWPLVVLYAAFPLWWLAGLHVLGFLVAAVPMAYYLLRLRQIRVPRGFGVWLLFLVWVAVGVVTVWMDAPGAQPAVGFGRMVPFSYRLAWYLALTVFLLYVGNLSEKAMPTRRVHRLLASLFLVTVAGGYLGELLPSLEFPSALELVLPRGIRGNDFLQLLIHPATAQVMDIGFEATRPKAPYTYANDWGANYGLLLPFFLLAWFGRDAGWRRRLAPVLLLAAIPPVIFSLNRGLWAGLAVMVVFVAARLALRGRLAAVGALLAATAVAGLVIALSPLGQLLQERIANPHSDEGRANLATMSLESAWEGSPVVGFGNTREVQGNFFSIAGGATAECPQCSPPQLGTQGFMWLLVFGSGFVGAALFVAFIAYRYLRGMRDPSLEALAITATGAFLAVVVFVYDLLGPPLVTVMVALGLLWRRERERAAFVPDAEGRR